MLGPSLTPTTSVVPSDYCCSHPGQCNNIHRSIASKFKYGLVYGKSSRFSPAAHRVGLQHKVEDEDVVALFTNS